MVLEKFSVAVRVIPVQIRDKEKLLLVLSASDMDVRATSF
jgi:hypothetical protein